MAAVNFDFDGITRGVDENEALFLAEKLERTSPILASEIRHRAETGLALETPGENISLDEQRKADLRAVLDQADLDAQLTHSLRWLQTGLHGERVAGEPPPPAA